MIAKMENNKYRGKNGKKNENYKFFSSFFTVVGVILRLKHPQRQKNYIYPHTVISGAPEEVL